jgi:SAM-dependent methyltransferase
MDDALIKYYNRRAPEYEQMWHRKDALRQAEQSVMASVLRQCFQGRRVLEVACGTGFWTAVIAEVAGHVCAIDASPQMLALAQEKGLPRHRVEFRQGDAFALETVAGEFNAGLANFWFSHVPKMRMEEFLREFHRRIGLGAVVFMADNVYVPGVGGELITCPGVVDTFKLRELADGSKHEVLKNYYQAGQLRELLASHSTGLEVHVGECFWWVSYYVHGHR